MILFALGFLLCAAPAGSSRAAAAHTLLARGPSAAKLVDRGVQYYYEGRYEKALKVLKQALDGGGLNKTRRIGAMQYLAFCHVALGQSEEARNAFNRILDEHPSFRPPAGTAPKIVQLFAVVKASRPAPELPPDIQHLQPDSGPQDRPVAIDASVENMPADAKLFVHYRHNSSSPYSRLEMTLMLEGQHHVKVPPPPAGKSEELSYFLTLQDKDGRRKGGLGSKDEPFNLPLLADTSAGDEKTGAADEEEESSTWWIWTLAGAVVVGAAVGVTIALTLPGDSEPKGSATFTFQVVE